MNFLIQAESDRSRRTRQGEATRFREFSVALNPVEVSLFPLPWLVPPAPPELCFKYNPPTSCSPCPSEMGQGPMSVTLVQVLVLFTNFITGKMFIPPPFFFPLILSVWGRKHGRTNVLCAINRLVENTLLTSPSLPWSVSRNGLWGPESHWEGPATLSSNVSA